MSSSRDAITTLGRVCGRSGAVARLGPWSSVIRRDGRQQLGEAWQDNGLVHTTKTGRPIEPRNLVRPFLRICANSHIRVIKVRHLRHTTATLLKKLGVPARDAQLIPGHSRLAVTLGIYTREDREGQRDALGKISDELKDDNDSKAAP